MSKSKIYISPHLDDAVFSCGGAIRSDVLQGHTVTVLTVFSTGKTDNDETRQLYETRKAEDRQACAVLGARPHWLDFRDAPYRHAYYNSFQRITMERHPKDNQDFTKQISAALQETYESIKPDEIIAPLGVGGHADHRLTYEAASMITEIPIRYYEERPYTFAELATRKRMYELGAHAPEQDLVFSKQELQAYLDQLSRLAYVKKYLPPGPEREKCFEIIKTNARKLPTPTKQIRLEYYEYNDEILKTLEQAVAQYKSQLPDIFENLREYKHQTKAYTRRYCKQGVYGERYLQFE